MYSAWTDHLDTADKKLDFKQHIKSSAPVLERLREIIQKEYATLDEFELSKKAFDTPNWAERQAFNNGYRSCLNLINKVTDIDFTKENL